MIPKFSDSFWQFRHQTGFNITESAAALKETALCKEYILCMLIKVTEYVYALDHVRDPFRSGGDNPSPCHPCFALTIKNIKQFVPWYFKRHRFLILPVVKLLKQAEICGENTNTEIIGIKNGA